MHMHNPLYEQPDGQKLPHICVILGYGKSGQASARFLTQQNHHVLVWDDQPKKQANISRDGFQLYDPENGFLTHPLQHTVFRGALIVSPGVPTHHGMIAAAQRQGWLITTDIGVFGIYFAHVPLIGVTGTNGKSTATALIAHCLNACNRPAIALGNIGEPILSYGLNHSPLKDETDDAQDHAALLKKDSLTPPTIGVIELSSFQLMYTHHISLEIGIMLPITLDHINEHQSFEKYVEAKCHLFRFAKHLILTEKRDDFIASFYQHHQAHHTWWLQDMVNEPVSEYIPASDTTKIQTNNLKDANMATKERTACTHENVTDLLRTHTHLKGSHQYINIGVACCALERMGLSWQEITESVQSFKGLAHRQQIIGTYNNILYINDSKATNMQAAAVALEAWCDAYDIYWLAGGKLKELSVQPALPYIDKVREIITFGQGAMILHDLIACYRGVFVTNTLEEAVHQAHQRAQYDAAHAPTHSKQKPRLILLSPGGSSLDVFENFTQRGDVFTEIVQRLV